MQVYRTSGIAVDRHQLIGDLEHTEKIGLDGAAGGRPTRTCWSSSAFRVETDTTRSYREFALECYASEPGNGFGSEPVLAGHRANLSYSSLLPWLWFYYAPDICRSFQGTLSRKHTILQSP
jgi:hypothetical protein